MGKKAEKNFRWIHSLDAQSKVHGARSTEQRAAEIVTELTQTPGPRTQSQSSSRRRESSSVGLVWF